MRLYRLLMLCALALCACAPKDNPLIWTEEVVMPDQRVVTLKRIQHFDEGDYVGAHSFEFEHPTTKQMIKWESGAVVNLSLLTVFMWENKAYILTSPRFGIDNQNAGCPYPSVLLFRWDGSAWTQVLYAQKLNLSEFKGSLWTTLLLTMHSWLVRHISISDVNLTESLCRKARRY